MTTHHRRAAARAATGLTVLTIAATAGLSPAAAAEADESEQTLVGPLITETSAFAGDPSTPTFSAPSAAAAGSEVPANRSSTLAAARASAVRWSIPAPGAVTTVRPLSDPELCLTAGTASITSYSPVTLETCVDGDAKQRFRTAANTGSNNPIGTGLQSTYNRGFLGLFNTDRVMRLQSQNVADRLPNTEDFTPSFSARVDSTDVATRSAQISGTGTPGATVLIDERNPREVGPDGRWTARVTNLPLGTSTLGLEQYEGTEQTGSASLEVTLTAAPLTFEATFAPDDLTAPVTASGTAQADADVRLFDGAGKQLGETVTAESDGTWETTIPAPNAGGVLRVTAAQFIDGARDTANEVTRDVDYGAAVAVTAPEDGAAHAGGPVTMSGTGAPGSTVQVVEVTAEGERVVGRSSEGVLPSGRWFVDTDDLDRAEHVLRVVQGSKGANTTTADVTINPGESGRLTPVRVTAPATVTPGVSNRISGTGEPGASFRVLNPSGTQIVPGTLEVDGDGNWSFERVVTSGATKFEFVIEQTKGDQGPEPSEVFTLNANQGFAPIELTTRAVDPGTVNTFEGTGPAGATLTVLNASGTQIVPETVTVTPEGTWSFERAVSRGATKIDFKFAVSVSGSAYTTSLFTVYANTR
ncbi:hypothetical protein NYS50_09035 [Curtobacterium flaccumfaciens pv. flaccumfaciens]|uniref:hypothetical protein n=1 Tax=Curtobacterium flaccumfaciens TaxID=2035 RepID=UPI00217E2A7B|nr:hypothetical protein [Curtobacterium flaccumfaciens]MCS6548020.1 hypothetical protein [Curtobacterium flaccumfaciens pv. flaccumfaciens]